MLPRFPAGKGIREIGSKRKGKRGKEEFLKGKCNQAGHHFIKGKEYASQTSEVNQMEAKEHELIFDNSEDELEAKQHDLLFDDSEEEPEEGVEVNKHETIQVSDAESTRNMYEDEGVDFDMILQAQQAHTPQNIQAQAT